MKNKFFISTIMTQQVRHTEESMQTLKNRQLVKVIYIFVIALLSFCFFSESSVKAQENPFREELLGNFKDSPKVKKTEDGFYYTMDSAEVMKQFRNYFPKKNSLQYRKFEKLYGKKKNCCYLLCYLGKKKNIRLPEQIEGVSNYVLCVSFMNGWNGQVKDVTIPRNVKIAAVMYDNPYIFIDIKFTAYNENRCFSNTYTVEKGNSTVKSRSGLLYSGDGKVLYGIPDCIKGKLIIPDSVEEAHISDYLSISELVIGKNVSKINKSAVRSDQIKKLTLNKDNKYFVISGEYLYDKNMKKKYIYINS